MAKSDEILAVVIDTKARLNAMADRLYDRDGDIPAIKDKLSDLNGRTQDQEGRLVVLETKETLITNPNNPHRRFGKKQTAIGGSITVIAGIVYGIGKGIGWW